MTIYSGQCHCGAIKFNFKQDITRAMRCNCSICRRTAAVFHPCSDEQLEILSGQDHLNEYQFGTHTAKHHFCKTCGITPFIRPRIAPHLWVVNLRCIDDVEPDELVKGTFDGINWEESAKALLQANQSGRA